MCFYDWTPPPLTCVSPQYPSFTPLEIKDHGVEETLCDIRGIICRSALVRGNVNAAHDPVYAHLQTGALIQPRRI